MQTVSIPLDESLLPAKKLRSGDISCIYEHGRLRYLKFRETEVIRMIFFAVRDQDWNTASYTIENELIETNLNGFSIRYTSIHKLNEIRYVAEIIIKAEENTISFALSGKAMSSFQRNRIGICILHPIKECRGKKVIITRPDNTKYTAGFPDMISPHQPFKDIKEMQYYVNESIETSLTFEGDVFETEDQRNWADSSFKTYSTPLDIPFPVKVNSGELVQQKITCKISGKDLKQQVEAIITSERKIPFPQIGYGSTNELRLNDDDINLLQEIPFNHYLVELFFSDIDWKNKLQVRIHEARKLKTMLQLVLYINGGDAGFLLQEFLTVYKSNSSYINSLLLLQQEHPTTRESILSFAYPELKKISPHVKVGYGTDGFFAELNRNRPMNNNFDFVCFSLSPQVHMTDTRSIVENLQHLDDLIATAQSFARGKEIYISPITFKTRNKAMQTSADSRQHRHFGACWMLATLKALSQAESLTFYEAKGENGILNARDLSPTYRILKQIKAFKPKWIINNHSSEKSFFADIVLENEEGNRLVFDLSQFGSLQFHE
jgi:hypothetical protein